MSSDDICMLFLELRTGCLGRGGVTFDLEIREKHLAL